MIHPPSSSVGSDPLAVLRRLTSRDRLLLSWLAEHYVLTTEQVAAALFPSRRAAQRRLTLLYRIGAVSRFAFARTDTQTGSYRYTLGPLGAILHPTAYTDPTNPNARPPRSHLQRRARILANPRLEHLLGVNTFFTDLYAYTRRHHAARLERWWSEQHTTAAYAAAGIRPDGHGIWRVADRVVGFFLEHDTGSEPLPRVIAKLRAYERLMLVGGPSYPVLLWLPDPHREARLLRTLAGVPTAMPVATAVHHHEPAGPLWALAAAPDRRLRLHELPSGPESAWATGFRLSTVSDDPFLPVRPCSGLNGREL